MIKIGLQLWFGLGFDLWSCVWSAKTRVRLCAGIRPLSITPWKRAPDRPEVRVRVRDRVRAKVRVRDKVREGREQGYGHHEGRSQGFPPLYRDRSNRLGFGAATLSAKSTCVHHLIA